MWVLRLVRGHRCLQTQHMLWPGNVNQSVAAKCPPDSPAEALGDLARTAVLAYQEGSRTVPTN
jgi:hypothetical protein